MHGGVILQPKLEVGFSFVVDDSFCLLGAEKSISLSCKKGTAFMDFGIIHWFSFDVQEVLS